GKRRQVAALQSLAPRVPWTSFFGSLLKQQLGGLVNDYRQRNGHEGHRHKRQERHHNQIDHGLEVERQGAHLFRVSHDRVEIGGREKVRTLQRSRTTLLVEPFLLESPAELMRQPAILQHSARKFTSENRRKPHQRQDKNDQRNSHHDE